MKLHPVDLLSRMAPLSLWCAPRETRDAALTTHTRLTRLARAVYASSWIGVCSVAAGEITEIMARFAKIRRACHVSTSTWTTQRPPPASRRWKELSESYALIVVLLSGIASFTLNITRLFANKLTSPVNHTITANVKLVRALRARRYLPPCLVAQRRRPSRTQVLMIAVSTMIFSTPIPSERSRHRRRACRQQPLRLRGGLRSATGVPTSARKMATRLAGGPGCSAPPSRPHPPPCWYSRAARISTHAFAPGGATRVLSSAMVTL